MLVYYIIVCIVMVYHIISYYVILHYIISYDIKSRSYYKDVVLVLLFYRHGGLEHVDLGMEGLHGLIYYDMNNVLTYTYAYISLYIYIYICICI